MPKLSMLWQLVFVLVGLLVHDIHCRSDITRAAQSHIHFQYEIEKSLFKATNVQFRASVENMPDLPKWLRLEQRDPTQPAFLYGTPSDKDVGQIFLEIIGWNKDDYSTIKKIMRITIEAKQASQVKYQVDFKITNFDLADFLLAKKYSSFSQSVQGIWPNAYLVTKIDKTVNRPGGRYTPTGVKEGTLFGEFIMDKFEQRELAIVQFTERVFITIGSENAPPAALKDARYCAGQQPKAASSSVYKTFASGEFTVSWCHLTTIELSLTSSGQQATPKRDPKDSFTEMKYSTVPYDTSRPSLTNDWMFVLIPILIGVIFISILTCLMCCKREGTSKRDAKTPSEQLEHHRALRRATYRMRTMNNKDVPGEEAPGDGSYPYDRLEDDSYAHTPKQGSRRNPPASLPSTPGTNQRSAVPPPYRMPPSMPSDQASDTDSVPSGPPPYKRPDEGRW